MNDDYNSGVTDLEVKPPATPPSAKPRVRHRQWGGAALGLLLGLGGLFAGRLGHLWPAFDVFSQFGAQFVFVVFAFAIATFMPRFKAMIGVILATCMVIAYGAWPHLVSHPLAKGPYPLAQGEHAFRFAHFNTREINRNNDAMVTEIERLAPDVMSLIEFDPRKLPMLQKLRQDYPYQYVCHGVADCNLAIISKFPILAIAAKTRWEGPPLISVRLGGALNGLTVYAVHTTRFPHSRAQLAQINALARRLEGEVGPVVVMGDFNATPFSRITTTLEAASGLNRLTQLPTWPSRLGLPQLAIDHVFASDGIRVLADQQIGDNAGSDHYPIVVTLGITPN